MRVAAQITLFTHGPSHREQSHPRVPNGGNAGVFFGFPSVVQRVEVRSAARLLASPIADARLDGGLDEFLAAAVRKLADEFEELKPDRGAPPWQ